MVVCHFQLNLVQECQQNLEILATKNEVTLKWVTEHEDIDHNEKVDALAKRETQCLFVGPEPTLAAVKTLRNGVN